MDIKKNLKSFITLFILLSALFIAGCGSTDKEVQNNISEENQNMNQADSNENEEESNNENNNSENDIMDNEDSDNDIDSDVDDGTLEIKEGNPVGDYVASGMTSFMIIKTDPETNKTRPGDFLEEDHPYVKEISDALEDLLITLYEIDYKTITDDRHEEYLIGELKEDSEFLNIAGELGNEVITEVKTINTKGIDFQDGMEQARVKSEIIYHVVQSSEGEGPFNRYTEGEDYTVLATSEVEKIDGEWKIVHILDGFPEILEDE